MKQCVKKVAAVIRMRYFLYRMLPCSKALIFGSIGYSSYWAETDFTLRVTVTLTFDLLISKSIGVFYSISVITLWILKALDQRVLKLLSGNGFHSLGHSDLDLWLTDLKINRVLLLNKGYHPMKIEGSGPKGTQVIERKRFSIFGSLWPWPLTYWPQNQ